MSRFPLVAFVAVLTLACSSENSLAPPIGPAEALVVPMCQLGCLDVDPNPEAPGVFLGSGVTDEVCFSGGQTDNDQDGLSTFCEKNLAVAFAPELWYAGNDMVGREPHWVAAPSPEDPWMVRVVYLLSYYIDLGTTDPLCNNSFADGPCSGHSGDSELIALDLEYNPETSHWVLATAWYSAHDELIAHARGWNEYPTQLTYPSHPGAYPRAWVAFGKHANYASQEECDAGGALGFDHCSLANTGARVAAGNQLNIGSRSVHTSAQDCMPSSNPIYSGNGVVECYWTWKRFSGWAGTYPDASAYSWKLYGLGF